MYKHLFILMLLPLVAQAQSMWNHPSIGYNNWKYELNRNVHGKAWAAKYEIKYSIKSEYAGMQRITANTFYNTKGEETGHNRAIEEYDDRGLLVMEDTPGCLTQVRYGEGWEIKTEFYKQTNQSYTSKKLYRPDSLLMYEDGGIVHKVYSYSGDNKLVAMETWRKNKLHIREEYLLQSDTLNKVRLTYDGKVYEAEYALKPWPGDAKATYCYEMRVYHQGVQIYKRNCVIEQNDSVFTQKQTYYYKGKLEGTAEYVNRKGEYVSSFYDAAGKYLGGREGRTEQVCPSENGLERRNETTEFVDRKGKVNSTFHVGYTPDCQASIFETRDGKHVYKTITYEKDGHRVRSETYDNDRLITRTNYTLTALQR